MRHRLHLHVVTASIAATVMALVVLASPPSVHAADTTPRCASLCAQDCSDVEDAGAFCAAQGCGTVGLCPGDAGNCDWDLDNYDEQVYCNWIP